MSYSHADCPFCPFTAPTNKQGQVRTDNLRTHVKARHPTDSKTIISEYEGVHGFKLEKIQGNLYIQTKLGKYNDGFCNDCATWIPLAGFGQGVRIAKLKAHECRPVQVRERKVKVVDGKIEVPVKKGMDEKALYKEFKNAGADDYVEFDEDLVLDFKKTLKKMMAAIKAPAPVNPNSILERLKKETRLASLNLTEREEQRRDAIEENNVAADEDEEIEIEAFDEYDDIILPCFVELARAAPQREKLSNTIKELRAQMDQREDATDMKQRELESTVADLKERIIEMSREISEERVRLHAREAHLKQKSAEAPCAEPDKIELVAGSDFSQWSLPFQG